MKKYNRITPHGTRDILFEECRKMNFVKERLSFLFTMRGYSEAVTPSLEYYDVFKSESFGLSQESLYKLTDISGRLLVMRPDITTPIARLTATRLKDAMLPIRLFYSQKVFRVNPLLGGRSDEITQSGIELIGAGGVLADLEVISLASEALLQCGFPNFRLELGHAGIFKELIGGLDIDTDTLEDIRGFIESKNFAALNELLDCQSDCPAVRALRILPQLFGGKDVFSQAKEILNKRAYPALLELEEQFCRLSELGLSGSLTVDLGMVHRNNYYTGVVFRGYIEGLGEAVLSGGRYDNLLSEFGVNLPATGFAIETDALCRAITENKPQEPMKVLIACHAGDEISAVKKSMELFTAGVSSELFTCESMASAEEYAREKGIQKIIFTGDGV